MIISSAYMFGRQITAGEEPFEVIWHNSRNASPMQSFGDNGNAYINRPSSNPWGSFVKRENRWYAEPPAGFIGIEATPTPINKLPYILTIPLLSNGEKIGYWLRYRAESDDGEITVYCDFGYEDSIIHSGNYGSVTKAVDDQSCNYYTYAGAGAFLGNRAGNTIIYDVTYIGAIADRVNASGIRQVDISGSALDLLKVKSYGNSELPTEWLT